MIILMSNSLSSRFWGGLAVATGELGQSHRATMIGAAAASLGKAGATQMQELLVHLSSPNFAALHAREQEALWQLRDASKPANEHLRAWS